MSSLLKTIQVDYTTGEVLKTIDLLHKGKDKRKYTQLMLLNYKLTSSMPPAQAKMLNVLAYKVEYDTNRIDLSPTAKKEIAADMGIKIKAFYNTYNSLKKAKLILTYLDYDIVNPLYMWKNTRKSQLELIDKLTDLKILITKD